MIEALFYNYMRETNPMKPLLWCKSILAAAYIFFRWAAEIIGLWSYCLWELEHVERPSVLGGVHSDEPSLFLRHISSTSISPQPQYLLNLNISSTSPHRPKVSLISPHKAEGLSAISASHTYYLCGSISSAALREESYYQWQHWFSTKHWRCRDVSVQGRASCPSKNNVRPIFQNGGVFLQRLCHFRGRAWSPPAPDACIHVKNIKCALFSTYLALHYKK